MYAIQRHSLNREFITNEDKDRYPADIPTANDLHNIYTYIFI